MVGAVWPEDAMLAARVPALVFTLRGTADLRAGDYVFSCPPGHFFLMPPDIPRLDGTRSHLEGKRRQNETCSLLWLRPLQDSLGCWICHSEGERHWSHQTGETIYVPEPQAMNYFGNLSREIHAKQPGWERMCSSLLQILFTTVWRATEELMASHSLEARVRHVPGEVAVWEPIEYAKTYALQNLKDAPSIDEMARVACLSRSDFTRRFRQETGQSFMDWLTERRLEEARRLLLDTEWSIHGVAIMVGIRAPRLRELFVEHEKMSPLQYRQSQREQNSALQHESRPKRPTPYI
jgi:AraC-like DNA-binding protein